MASAKDEYPSTSRCVGLDDTTLRAVGPIPKDPATAWARHDLFVLGRVIDTKDRREIEKRRNDDEPHIFRVVSSEHGCQDETPEESIRQTFRRRKKVLHASQGIRNTGSNKHLDTAPTNTLNLPKIPPEILNMIVSYTLEAPLDLYIRTDTRPEETAWERSGKIRGTYDRRHEYTTKDYDEWLQGRYKNNIPLALVSKHLRNTVSLLVAKNRKTLKDRIGRARVTFTSSTLGNTGKTSRIEDPKSWIRIGTVLQGIWYDLGPRITSRITRLQFAAVWDKDQDRLVTPLRDIVGFVDEFERLRTIAIRCRILFSGKKPTYVDLVKKPYRAEGIYDVIVGEIAAVTAAAIVNRKHDRCGIVPGCCLVPNCETRRSMATIVELSEKILGVLMIYYVGTQSVDFFLLANFIELLQ
ncbi:hypothetical protein SPBR_08967 [Sporothrix brasiliensis 5110]|uniref:Uncharacterized protein n=1 Tax=Sporothrix brasiliensis 5110 TaxID=1398154 RepID=A0A0C2IUQ2_9PEZI|nr:uncharacterized protein SPBR_08967 [Sporothrix brasiliensis 5110]KIH88712.1 hypothetical protein SPBR_08967 [Sporothrix brasiliensis 5110]